jgi:hypothetical protein
MLSRTTVSVNIHAFLVAGLVVVIGRIGHSDHRSLAHLTSYVGMTF